MLHGCEIDCRRGAADVIKVSASAGLGSRADHGLERRDDGLPVATTVTNANGQYSFQSLVAGNYLVDLLEGFGKSASNRSELTVEDGRVFNALISPIPQVGIVFTLSDITNLIQFMSDITTF